MAMLSLLKSFVATVDGQTRLWSTLGVDFVQFRLMNMDGQLQGLFGKFMNDLGC